MQKKNSFPYLKMDEIWFILSQCDKLSDFTTGASRERHSTGSERIVSFAGKDTLVMISADIENIRQSAPSGNVS